MMSGSELSALLERAQDGSVNARDSVYSLLHQQLRHHAYQLMRNERPDHTLQASALVNEACLKLIAEGALDSVANRRQLFHTAIRAMREVLIDHARACAAQKRGCGMQRQVFDEVLDRFEATHSHSFLDLEDALQRLKVEAPREYDALNFRFFGGLSIAETARLLDCSPSTVEADWRFARAKLLQWLGESE